MRPTRTATVVVNASGKPSAIRQPAFLLKVVKGPDRGREKRSAERSVLIGSSAEAQLALTDPTVSAVHGEVVADERGFRVRDLGSKNGLLLDGRRVLDAWLRDRDLLQLGKTAIRFTSLSETEDHDLSFRSSFGQLVGGSIRMRELYVLLAKAAETDVTVLIRGETGTGKELAADAIVSHGPRKDAPLVVVDCASLPATLAESELFGHEKGAFTGATESFRGAFERANGGTLFLDEIGELPLELQAKLLGALERREIRRLGGQQSIRVDVRVIAATHRELEREVNRGTFRADLFYRLAVVQLRMPALRERSEDIPELVAHFLGQLPGAQPLPERVLKRLGESDYPGNVRELRNAVERAALGLELPPPSAPLPGRIDRETPYRIQKEQRIAVFERQYLSEMLEACEGNVSEVARRSGINRVHLHEMVHRLGLVKRK